MAYCANCGLEVEEYDKYCPRCGLAVRKIENSDNSNNNTKRKVVFEGELKKCPNCGEVLNSFTTNCPSCGFELRNAHASSSVQELSEKIREIDSHRNSDRKNDIAIDKQISNIIISFPIPNTKEDILEFMILASSNIDTSDAWIPKVEQAYKKASTLLKGSDDLKEIEQLYKECKIHKRKRKKIRKPTKIILIVVVAHIGFFALLFLLLYLSGGTASQKNEAEEKRLNAIVEEVDDALVNNDYTLAMRIVESMKYNTYDKERERWWGIKKESMIDEIISKAHADGVEIERPTDISITTPPTTSKY